MVITMDFFLFYVTFFSFSRIPPKVFRAAAAAASFCCCGDNIFVVVVIIEQIQNVSSYYTWAFGVEVDVLLLLLRPARRIHLHPPPPFRQMILRPRRGPLIMNREN